MARKVQTTGDLIKKARKVARRGEDLAREREKQALQIKRVVFKQELKRLERSRSERRFVR